MGLYLLDQYSLLHVASGIIAYFWGLNLKTWIILHIIFEIIENTPMGINFINNYIYIWPGGKNRSDSLFNMSGDVLSGIIGWLSAYYLDKLGQQYGWYKSHIK
jgi:hypothetical protein